MDSVQYEELCRYYVAKQTGLDVAEVRSVHTPNPKRPGLPGYKHQIDLYWETGDETTLYLNIANAKWRGSARVEQGEILLLQQVRQQVAAHKAFMLTNVGYTAGAVAAAKDHGIALHRVSPEFDVSRLPKGDRSAIQAALCEISLRTDGSIYSLHVEQRGLGFGRRVAVPDPVVRPTGEHRSPSYETRVMRPASQPSAGSISHRSISGSETRGGNRPSGGGFVKK